MNTLKILKELCVKEISTERKMTLLAFDDDHLLCKDKEEKSMYERRQEHIPGALCCFLESVTNSSREHKFFLEDCPKTLNLISMANEAAKVIDELSTYYKKIRSEGLIDIILQIIIARLDSPIGHNKDDVEIMRNLLVYVGTKHYQALFPLIFRHRCNNQFKNELANVIFDDIAQNNHSFEPFYRDGQLIVEELCEISLTLREKVFIFMTGYSKHWNRTQSSTAPHLPPK
jgi:hypothetical protein